MDQVTVNFLFGARAALGYEFNDPRLGDDLSKWDRIASMPGFWRNLPWMPWAYLFLDLIENSDSYALTAIPPNNLTPLCAPEKKEWCQIHLHMNESRVHTVQRHEKALYATTDGKPNLLIDDHPGNCKEWQAAGGIAIRHRSVRESINLAKMYLRTSYSLWPYGDHLYQPHDA